MKRKIAIIGGGTAGMMLGIMLDTEMYDVTIYERNPTLGRKFLVAGKGGFNLTYSEPMKSFIQRYHPVAFLQEALTFFDNDQLIRWLDSIGVKTFVGSSHRVFPDAAIKPAGVLKSFIEQLTRNNVSIQTNMKWTGWNERNELIFLKKSKKATVHSDIQVFALGGSSWKITGSDGQWIHYFIKKKVPTTPFASSNCAVKIDWSNHFIHKAEGSILKNIVVSSGNKRFGGDVVISKFGMEGTPVYALSSIFRQAISKNDIAHLYLDLKPQFSKAQIIEKLSKKRSKSWTDHIQRQLKLSRIAVDLLYENTTKLQYNDIEILSGLIKKLPLKVKRLAPLDEAISTVGGIALQSCDKYYQLNNKPNTYVIGEMLDWDAPTGGYLLQVCFSMAAFLAHHLNEIQNPK